MNLTKALKTKKKLVKQADEFYNRFASSNSTEEGSEKSYSPEEYYEKWLAKTEELIELKTKIQLANQPIADKIFRLGELKNQVSRLKKVNTRQGTKKESYSDNIITYKAWMSEVTKDTLVEQLENSIESLQEEIEAFNALTKI